MDAHSIERAVAELPGSCEPLLLSFLRPPFQLVDGAAVIGNDEGTDLRVELVTGHVWSLDPRNDLPPRFVNTSIALLGATIAAYLAYATAVRAEEDERDARQRVGALRHRIGSLDAAAIADGETWWSLILEQAEEGLL